MAKCLGFRKYLGCRVTSVKCLGCRVRDHVGRVSFVGRDVPTVQGSGFRVQGSGCKVLGSGFRV